MKIFFELYWVFFKVAISTFGGGYAILPILEAEIVKKRKWTSKKDLLDYYAISQATPGIIGVNISTFIGYKYKGVIGAIIATAGIVTPSLIMITLISTVLQQYMHNIYVEEALKGVRVFMAALIAYTLISFWKSSVVDYKTFLIFVLSCALVGYFNISIVLVIVIAICLGHLFNIRRTAK